MSCCDSHAPLPRGARSFSRRELFSLLARGAGAAALAPSLLELLCRHSLAFGAQAADKKAAHKKLLLLWLEGGPSQVDTFDPKPGTPVQGPFKVLSTDVKGLQMTEHLSGLAKRAQHLSVIRTMTSKEGSHARARALLHTGYSPNPTVAFPTLGSIVAHEIGDLDHELPAFVQIDGPPGSGGYLGVKSTPFVISDPTGHIENLAYARGVDKQRMDHREEMRSILDAEFSRRGGGPAVDANQTQRNRARRLMDTKLLSAFDLTQEKDATRDAYGPSKFGQGVLLARRLLEHGVASVEVVLGGWDTHLDNFNRTQKLCEQLDPAFSALLDDLKSRGTYDQTLVVCMGEFGRTPDIVPGDGRNHWPANYCVALAGGGIKPGMVIGETDELGKNTVSHPVQVADLFATIGETLGIQGDKEFHTATRPVKLIDQNGKVLKELLA